MNFGETLLYVTTKDVQDAERIGRALVEKRLAACVNILAGMRSMYWWNGKVETAQETVLLVKTTQQSACETMKAIVDLHEYDVPCVMAFSVQGGHQPFLDWIHQVVDG